MKKENKERVMDLIKDGKSYKETLDALHKERSDTIAGSTFYKLKQSVYPSEKMDAALEESGEKRVEREKTKQQTARRVDWTPAKQKAADTSKLAELINKGVYAGTFPFCKNKSLKEEDVQSINIGGAVVSNILYFFPYVNLDHPAIVLVTRAILFYLRFKQICTEIKEKVNDVYAKLGLSGVKPDWKNKGEGAEK